MRAVSAGRRRLAVVAAGVLALAVMPALAAAQSATVSATVGAPAALGTDVGSQQPGIAWEQPAQMNANLDAMVAAGMTWVRADFFWDSIEQQPGLYSWTATDTFVEAAESRGLHILAIADYTPSWARTGPTDKYPPTDPNDYATFVGALAQHYAPMGVHDWEIWNEPNNAAFWAPKADPLAYTRLLVPANAAIKQADPTANVVTGGLSPAVNDGSNIAPLTYLAAIYADGGGGSFDAVGYHPYSYPYSPMYAATWNTFYEAPAVHALMAANGDGAKQIWGTEVGFPTGTSPNAVTPAVQAADISAAITQWTSWSFHGPIIFYTIRDSGTDPSNVDENMGLLDASGAPKLVFSAVQQQLAAPPAPAAPPATPAPTAPPAPPAPHVTTPVAHIVPGVGKVAKPARGTVTMRIPVTLDIRSSVAVTVHYTTASLPPTANARSGVDYVGKAGVLTFAPGQTRLDITVTVRAHSRRIPNDRFIVRFSDPSHAVLGGYGIAIGVIR
jgi:polysaccharide biosynthesis protein PslG